MSNKRKTDRTKLPDWKKNLLFVLVVLAAAAAIGGYYLIRRANRPEKMAHLVYGTAYNRTETEIDLWEDADYTFSSNGYEIHLQVRDGGIAFVDSPCPDHVCESFGTLSEVYDWAACMPAQAMLTIEAVE